MAAQAINDWTEGWMDGLMDSCMAEWLSGCVMLKPAAHGKSQQGYLPGYAAPKMSSAINPDKARYCQSIWHLKGKGKNLIQVLKMLFL